ncbi:hypothetical protein BDV96DRAFT_594399 [Lophiotrema nucula]|uniref:Uncharacterized protein n=1 Tax=Lophiotrema nucula TaxID=690887 RepID=A0A6A5ZNC3_9PLEO|nr:hypothetical protein BDV96DRAFT_594399 [Lophiotrema nucula]
MGMANPDIARPGVVWSFVVSAGLACLSLLLFYLLRPTKEGKRANKVNQLWTERICKKCFQKKVLGALSSKPSALLAEVCFRVVLAPSDQQLATGFAMLLAGLILLGEGRISASISLHGERFQRTLTESHRIHRRQRPHPRSIRDVPIVTWFRILMMVGIAGMLVFVTSIEGYGLWYREFARPAHCLPHDPSYWYGKQKVWAIASFCLLGYYYPEGIIILLTKATALMETYHVQEGIRHTDTEDEIAMHDVLAQEAESSSRASAATSLRPLRSSSAVGGPHSAQGPSWWWSGLSACIRLRSRATRHLRRTTQRKVLGMRRSSWACVSRRLPDA